ncbi:SDR family NAD(P)-dependent oxidoreductase (plasmid) [Rhizobium sp. CB3060]|uniref:SDR family NAD(P)-dependent oxidoreductase n=1 Tax=Rhizobium sp. CB3060 TaxID=3138255 RepID=UPI0021A86A89|nr:SDR family NAD(P)-dependent oxidoreductase [Rhizobium tropici]UWU25644.1 SDR family NAD(P)-dependent oxidoreductase [Rhizobium tropici]
MKLEKATFLITGAGSGLGAAVAKMAVSHGANVMLVDTREDSGRDLASTLGMAARFRIADVTSAENVASAVAAARNTFGRLDILVNCAGIAPSEKIVGRGSPHDLDTFSRTVTVNLVGTFNTLRLAADVMTRQAPGDGGERGLIINTASIAAFEGQIGQAAYAASKGGVAALTLPAARELGRHSIRVVAIAPGIFATPMMTGMPQEVQDALGAAVPYPPRLGRPEEYAALVRHVVENQMLNGVVIRLDGALRMAPR